MKWCLKLTFITVQLSPNSTTKGEEMTYCVPMKEMKDTSSFADMIKQTNHPVFVTKNGREEFVVMSTEVFERTHQFSSQFSNQTQPTNPLYAFLAKSEEDAKNGKTIDAFDYLKTLEDKYGES